MKCASGIFFVILLVNWVHANNDTCLNIEVLKIHTPDDINYKFFEMKTNAFRFKVKAANDAHVGLFITPDQRDPFYEIVIGGWGNTKSVIRKDKRDGHGLNDVVGVLTNYYLDKHNFKEFFIWFSNHTVTVGYGDDPFMVYRDGSMLLDFSYLAVHTGFGATGEWVIEVPTCKNNNPECSVKINHG